MWFNHSVALSSVRDKFGSRDNLAIFGPTIQLKYLYFKVTHNVEMKFYLIFSKNAKQFCEIFVTMH